MACAAPALLLICATVCESGGIGRRTGLRIQRFIRGGSIPPSRTSHFASPPARFPFSARSRVKLPAACLGSMSQSLPSSLLFSYRILSSLYGPHRPDLLCEASPAARRSRQQGRGCATYNAGQTVFCRPRAADAPGLCCPALYGSSDGSLCSKPAWPARPRPVRQTGEKIAQGAPCGIYH